MLYLLPLSIQMSGMGECLYCVSIFVLSPASVCVCVICAHMHNVTCHRCTDCQCVQEWLAIDKENVDGQLPEIRSLFMNLATQK